jgi:nucleotide-binding universal stress UspA family protein
MRIARDTYSTPKKILLPMDFSKSSYRALEMAGDLAELFHAQICMVHIIPEIPVFTGVDYFPETAVLQERRGAIEQRLDACKTSLAAKGLCASSSIETGNDVVGNIMLVIEREHIDMVVISTHGLSGWHPLVFGSIAEKVIKLVECPLLLLRTAKPAAVAEDSLDVVRQGTQISRALVHTPHAEADGHSSEANTRLQTLANQTAQQAGATEQQYDQEHAIFTK